MNPARVASLDPLLTVTVTNYNYATCLSHCLDSILQQSFADFEIVVIDNASTDNSVALLQEYARRDSRLRLVVHEKNMGLGYSLRESCELARGKYCVHLDPDDWILDPQAFALQIQMLESDAEIAFVYSKRAYSRFPSDPSKTWYKRSPHPSDTILPGEQEIENCLSWYVAHSGPMFRLDSFRAIGGYSSEIRHAIDIKLPSDLCRKGKVGYINRPLYVTFEHEDSLQRSTKIEEHLDEIRQIALSFTSGPAAISLPHADKIRNRVLARTYFEEASYYIFTQQLDQGWRRLQKGWKANSIWILSQPGLYKMLVRALAGALIFPRHAARNS